MALLFSECPPFIRTDVPVFPYIRTQLSFMFSIVMELLPEIIPASGILGVMRLQTGMSSFITVSMLSESMSSSPLVATITGSKTTLRA